MPLFRKPPPTDHERTPEEREAEREERERRRAERAGRAYSPGDTAAQNTGPDAVELEQEPAHPGASPSSHDPAPAHEPPFVAALEPEHHAPEPPLDVGPEHPAPPAEAIPQYHAPPPPIEAVPEHHAPVQSGEAIPEYDAPPPVDAEPHLPLASEGGVPDPNLPLASGDAVEPVPLPPADPAEHQAPPTPAETVREHPAPLMPAEAVPEYHAPPPVEAVPEELDHHEQLPPHFVPEHDEPLPAVEALPEEHAPPPPVEALPEEHHVPSPSGFEPDASPPPVDAELEHHEQLPPDAVPEHHEQLPPHAVPEHHEPLPAIDPESEPYVPLPHADAPAALPPSAEPAPAALGDTMEHAALEHHLDKPVDGPQGPEPARPSPVFGELDSLPPLPPLPARRAAGAGRAPRRSRHDALLERRARRLNRPGRAGGPRSLLRPAGIAAVLAIAAVIALLWFLVSLFQPLKGAGHGRVVVIIPHGSGAHAIGNLLASRGVVASGFFFDVRAAVDGKRGQLHSGVYTFKRDMSYAAAIDELIKPPPAPPVIRVAIPEGYARVLIAKLARDDGLAGDYLAASRRSSLLRPASYGAPPGTPHLEGFLFPATYDLKAGTDVAGLVAAQLTAFKSHFGPPQASAARALHVTLYDLLIVASMVEREALLARDRPLVAAVIYNRLRQHTPLGIDATIRYALNKWSSPLTVSDLRINSPYNTRTRDGLPPTPIGNPGMASIDAAAHPAHVSYLYYVNGSDGCGDLKFSTSFSQFQANAAAYQAALTANGGRVPACKK